ncbi:hypothetical protein CVT25_012090 [Psilocybe cyanescens]|uniref:Uncharacterized protein n=1 Tax=Psilocybe cyanescens TaxID=93625 RepID=A0A409VMZ8_PSICY|nr:hypothetical protein CVT25_012090 [Psilocybe cyanescens]
MTSISERDERRLPRPNVRSTPITEDDTLPKYDAAEWQSFKAAAPFLRSMPQQMYKSVSTTRRPLRPLPQHERYVYTYRLVANNAPMQFMISVEPESGKAKPGKYTFRLSLKANGIERSLSEPTTRNLKVDPRKLDFIVFIFPGKSGLPTGSLWSIRVWLRVNFVDHRLFGDDDLWIAKDPDFNSIGDASFARMKSDEAGQQIYNTYVGRALVTFIIKWQPVGNKTYAYSMEYEANGVGDMLFEDYKLRVDEDPRKITFLIFTIPSNSIPAGASHKVRVWLRSLVPLPTSDPTTSYALPFNDSFIYQRIWKCDNFKMGARLDFGSLGPKMVMGFSSGVAETIITQTPPTAEDLTSPRSIYREKRGGYDF